MIINPWIKGMFCGRNSVVEYLVANEVVVGSNPIARSCRNAGRTRTLTPTCHVLVFVIPFQRQRFRFQGSQ